MSDERVARGMRRQLELRRERLAGGERHLGWKVGFGSPAALERLALAGPLVGFLTDRGLLGDGASCPLAGWTAPALEAEIAVHLGRDGAVAGLGAAIELADVDSPPDDVERILAGDIFHRHVLLGPVDRSRRAADGVRARVLRNGAEVASTAEPEALTGTLPDVLRHVAETLAESGERLRAGDVVIAGSVVPPLAVAPGEELVVELPPLGTLRVSLR